MIEVTDIKVFPFEPGDPHKGLKAYAEITLNDGLVIKGIKIFESKAGGMFIGYPAQKGRDDSFHDLIIPKTPEIKKHIRNRVIEAYKKMIE